MLSVIRPLVAGGLCLSVAVLVEAQPSYVGNYPIGVEGIKAGSLPPPGFYLRDYNLFYGSSRLNDPDGNEVPVDLKAFGYANAIRPIWITKATVLGGSYGLDILVPLIYKDLELRAPGLSDSQFNLGDIFIEPVTLSWHWKQSDLGIGYGVWAPTGDYKPGPYANTGQGVWGHMFTLGGTLFADEAKTVALTALARYEINHENSDTDITPGQALSLEWGISQTIAKFYDIGVVGYWQQQTTKDAGPGASNDLDRVAAVGPEVNILLPELFLFASLRYNYEFTARDRPQGHTVTFTLTKRF